VVKRPFHLVLTEQITQAMVTLVKRPLGLSRGSGSRLEGFTELVVRLLCALDQVVPCCEKHPSLTGKRFVNAFGRFVQGGGD
jgi:hypothetical protein